MQSILQKSFSKPSSFLKKKYFFLGAFTLLLITIPNVLKQYFNNSKKQAISCGKIYMPLANGLSPFIKKTDNKNIGVQPKSTIIDTTQIKKSDWFTSVKKDLNKRMYYVNAAGDNKSYNSINASQGLKTTFNTNGFTLYSIPDFNLPEAKITKKASVKNNWNLKIDVKGLYADDKLIQPQQEQTINTANNVEYSFGNAYSIQYHNDEKGIRQNFIIKQAPAKNTKELKIKLHADGNWVVNKVHDKELHFAKHNNNHGLDNKVIYNDLKVWDANGKTLAAKMIVGNDNNFEIVADAAGAAYPVTIDPLSTTPSATLTGVVGNFGFSVASAGDINGDGYSDVIVGSDNGTVSIYLGSMTGVSTTAATTITGGVTFGAAVASAGDINKDGFSDIIIGDAAGNAYIFTGSSTGIAATTSAAATTTLTGVARFGASVANAGDINGDGYSDVIIGDAGGNAFIFNGSAAGIISGASVTASTTLTSISGPSFFGVTVASAGDINADGFSDVIIGNGGGGAFIFTGSALGIASGTTAGAITLSGGTGSFFGATVSSAGDVNGDGYSDVVVGNAASHAFVYLSAGSSINGSTLPTVLSGGTNFGFSVAGAGDVNGDAFGDIIIGDENGNAAIYYGSAAGVPATASITLTGTNNFGNSVASAGDINGDGYSDVIVGSTGSGSAFTYQGSPATSTNIATAVLNGQNAGDQFGYSVASAGDVNGDGYNDVIIGANGYIGGYANRFSATGNLGAFYIYLGSASGLSTTPEAGTPFIGPRPGQGANDGNFGFTVSSAGDVNGDGYGDVVIGGIGYNSGADTYEGIVYLLYGSAGGLQTGSPLIITDPPPLAFNEFGSSVASAGDVNGDGYGDVIIGAQNIDLTVSNQGAAYIYLGSATGLITANPPRLTFPNPTMSSLFFGTSVAGAGDVNGDGFGDVIVGTGPNGNEAFIFFGSPTGIADNASPDVTLVGNTPFSGGGFGTSVSSAGDVNGDGFSDVLVGAPGGYFGTTGYAALFLGTSSGTATVPQTILYGVNSNDQFGVAVASAGDVNGDGYSDIIVKSARGPVYLFQGGATVFPATVSATAANQVYTDAADGVTAPNGESEFNNHLSIASAGDVNGDGYSDIVVGSFQNPSFTQVGSVFVYYGNNDVGHNSSNILRLYETNLASNLRADNVHSTQFGLGLTVQSPFGHVNGRLVWEVVPNGIPFSGNPITNSVITTGQQTAYATIAPGGTEFKSLVNKAIAKATKVRARIQYASTAVTFGQTYSPWIYSQVYLTTGSSNVLPLNLISLTATPLDQNIVLNWKTAQEQNTKSFIIEHSLDAQNFTALDSVNAKGNTTSTTSYNYTHYHPAVGIHYYRLKEEDLNGRFTYSKIVSATILANGPQFSIYPNPTSDQLVITYSGINQSNVVRIMDGAGNIVRQYSLNQNGIQTTVSLKGIAKGTYFVQVVNSGFAPKQVSVQ